MQFVAEIKEKLDVDSFGNSIFAALRDGLVRHPNIDLGTCKKTNEGLLEVNGLIYIPNDEELQQRIISFRLSHPVAGHPE